METRSKLIIVFNDDIRARQGKADSQKHQRVTSRPDQIKLNRQDFKYTGIIIDNETNTAGQELTNNHIKQGQENNHIRNHEAGTQDTHDRGLTVSWCS